MLLKGCLTDLKLLHETKGTWEKPILQGKNTPGMDGRKKENEGRSKKVLRTTNGPLVLCLGKEANIAFAYPIQTHLFKG